MIGEAKTPWNFLSEIWANRWIKLLVLLAVLAALVLFLSLIWPVLKLLVIALVLAYLFDPVADKMQTWRLPRTAAVALLALFIVLAVTGFLALFIPFISENISNFVSNVPAYSARVRQWLAPVMQRLFEFGMPATLEDWVASLKLHTDLLQNISAHALATLKGTFSGITGFVATLLNFIVVPVAWFYLLRDIDPMKEKILQVFPPRHRETVKGLALEIDTVIANFMRGQLTICLFLGLMYGTGLQFVAGVPLGILIGLFAGFASIVPYLGVVLGIGPAIILAALEHGDLLHPILVIAVFAAVQTVSDNFIAPRIIGERLGLHPVTVIFAILIWGSLLGLTGMLIAVPITAVFRVFGKKALDRYKAGDFFRFGISKPGDV